MNNTVCDTNLCTGCMACVEICPKNAIHIEDTLIAYNAIIDLNKCISCHACTRVCQNKSNQITLRKPIAWYQGWSTNEVNRNNSSSGGAASELARTVIGCGGSVFSCIFEKGAFIFDEADTIDDLKKFAGSKYVKSNPIGVYRRIKEKLKEGRKVLFIGLPCQVAALNLVVGENDNLITVDLICHGTPSPKTLDIFLKQYGCRLDSLDEIHFRSKAQFRITSTQRTFTPKGVRDTYMIAFLKGLIYTDNCYQCKYARRERVSDITIGDSWESDLPLEEQKKGISLILTQTEKGKILVEKSNMKLNKVDIEKAIKANHQLQHPSPRLAGTRAFFSELNKGKDFNKLVKDNFPQQYYKQRIKAFLTKLGLFDWGGVIDYRISVSMVDDGDKL